MYIELGLRSAPAINATVVFFCDDDESFATTRPLKALRRAVCRMHYSQAA